MRQIVLDTETTGLSPQQGHRIIEFAGVEMIDRKLTGRHLHVYINPEREIDAGAQNVHGISLEFLQDKPLFADVADEILHFIKDAELIIHNAPFDMGFLNHEYALLGRVGGKGPKNIEKLANLKVTDTLKMAKERDPGKKNNLDALCARYEINNSHRTLHGALLDSELLADVYLAMTRGQDSLIDDPQAFSDQRPVEENATHKKAGPLRTGKIKVIIASETEEAEHNKVLDAIAKECKGTPVWRKGSLEIPDQ